MKHLKLFLSLLMVMALSLGNAWADDPTVLFHETFGNNTGTKAVNWDNNNSVKSGVAAVYANVTGYTVTNAKQSKNTNGATGSSDSGLQNTSSSNVQQVASFEVGPLSVANYTDLAVSYKWKAASTNATYYAKLYYKTSSGGSYTEVSGTGNGATTYVTRSFSLPVAAQVSTLYLKAEWYTSNTTAFIDEFELTGFPAAAPEPTVSVDPSPIAFGNVKQYSEGQLGTPYVFKNFTVTGENLTSKITVNAPSSALFDLWNVSAESVIGSSIDLTPDANGDVSKELAIMAATSWSGAQNSSITISGDDLDADMTINITMTVTPRYVVDVAVNEEAWGSATINGGSVAYVEDDSEELTLVATPKPGYEFVNWTYDDTKVLLTDDDEASTTAYAYEAATITANFQAMSCTGLAAPTLNKLTKSYDYANIKWTAVANASTYVFNLTEHEGDPHITNLVTPDLETDMLNLKANTQYDYTVMAVGDGTSYCEENNPLLEGSFTTEDYPTATLTLSENGKTRTWGSDLKLTSVIALPTAVAAGQEVAGKVLVGYTNEANKEYSDDTDAPSVLYAPGANYTIAATADKLYAVYAKVTGDLEPVKSQTLQYDTWTYSGATSDKTSYRLFGEDAYVESASFDRSTLTKVTVYAGKFGSVSTPKLIVSDGTNTWAESPELTTKSHETQVDITDGTALTGTGTIRIISNAGDGGSESSSSGIRLSKVEIYTQTPVSYSKYATTGAKAPAATVDPTSVNLTAAAANGVVDVTYANVDEDEVAVALFNDAECSEAFDGGWLTAELNGDNDIAYAAQAAVSYVDARTAYIKLTAPSTDNTVDPAVVVIPVTQAKKDAVFTSFEELNNSDLPRTNAGTAITITFSNEEIASVSGKSVYLNIADKVTTSKNIQIYGPSNSSWNAGGLISSTTSISGTWKLFSGAMELAISTWEGISYTPRYAVTFSAPANGTLVVKNGGVAINSGDFFEENTVLTVEAEPASALYELATLTAGGVDIKASKEFTIGTADVAVVATYALKPFASLEALVAANLDMNVDQIVTVSFSDVEITEIKTGEIFLNVKDEHEKNISIYVGEPDVPTGWSVGGKVSGTAIVGLWVYDTDEYYWLMPNNDWTGISYTPRYAVTFSDPDHGTLVVKNGGVAIKSGDFFEENTVLTVEAEPENINYKLNTLNANSSSGNEDIRTSKQFTVGTSAVTVIATFVEKPAANISWENTADDVREYGEVYSYNTWKRLNNVGSFNVSVTSSNTDVIPSMQPYGNSTNTTYWFPTSIAGTGTTTITATFAGNDNFRETSVSYDVIVKAASGLAWSAESADVRYGADDNEYPTLTNTHSLAVTYSSSNTDIATISNEEGHEGEITLKANGSTTIKASFAGDETYAPKEVSYTLNVSAGIVTVTPDPVALDLGEVLYGDVAANYGKSFHLHITNLSPNQQIAVITHYSQCYASPKFYDANGEGVLDADVTILPITNLAPRENPYVDNIEVRCTGTREFADIVVGTASFVSVQAYAITVTATTNGSVTLNGAAAPKVAKAGTTFTLATTPAEGYVLDALTITDGEETDIKDAVLSGSTLTMPASAMIITATFKLDGGGTALDNAEAQEKAVKFIENNQIFIRRGDKTFNAQGQLVK